jgi:N-acetyl-anhydromuramyl-L-alanine amidase AmpD
MAYSSEYPDLPWMPPKSWDNTNRSSVQLVVIHTTEGSAHSQSAEDGAHYDQNRTDGTSTHYFHDSDSTIQCVHSADQAHAARTQGNKRGIQHELCTKANSANWSDSYHQAMLRRAAKQAARDAEKWGIPVKKLSSNQVASGVKGFCGHVDITYAFPQDNGTHTDPGSNFPWSQFLGMVQDELEGIDMTETQMRDIIRDELGKFFPEVSNGDVNETSESRIGNQTWDQGVPDPEGTTKQRAYRVFKQIGVRVKSADEKLDQVLAKLTPPTR